MTLNVPLSSAELYSEPLVITSLSPPSAAINGGSDVTVTVLGSDFQSDSAVQSERHNVGDDMGIPTI